MKHILSLTAIGALVSLLNLPAHASFVLYDTATDSSNNIIAPGAADSHWLVTNPAAVTFSPVRINQPALSGIWLPENPTPGSATGWLSTTASTLDAGTSSLPGSLYRYTTSFDLTGLDPASAFINLCWSMDDWDTFGILLNGVTVPGSTANYQGFSAWTPISIPVGSSFTGGINTLEFIVGNGSGGTNPTGIMVDFKSYGAVPEPSAAALGLGTLGLLLRRRRAS